MNNRHTRQEEDHPTEVNRKKRTVSPPNRFFLFSLCRPILGIILLALFLTISATGAARAGDQPGIDDFVDLVNGKITNIQNELRKGPGGSFSLVESDIDWVIHHLNSNWHTLSAVIAAERATNPSYTPKTLLPLPRELTKDYFRSELTKLNAVYRDLLEKIDKLKITVGIKKFATLVNVLYAAYETASTATGLLNPNVVDLYNLPGKVEELKKLADQINTSANNLSSAREALNQAIKAKDDTVALFLAVRATSDRLVAHEVKLNRLKELRDLAADCIATGSAVLTSPPPPVDNNFNADPFITEINRVKSRLENRSIRWPAAAKLRDVIHDRAQKAYDASDKDADDTAAWSDYMTAYNALQALFSGRNNHVANLAAIGNEWRVLVASLLDDYQAISAGTDSTELTDCSALHSANPDFDPNLVVGYYGGVISQEWWEYNSATKLALKQSNMPLRQGERTLDLSTGAWLDFVAAYPGRVKSQLLDPYVRATNTVMASMNFSTERNQHVLKARPSKAYQMPLLTRQSLDTMRRNLRLIQGALLDFEGDFRSMVNDMQALESRLRVIQDKATAYRSYVAANGMYLHEGDFVYAVSAAHNTNLTIYETDVLVDSLRKEISSLPTFANYMSDSVSDVWEQASSLERWLDDMFRFNEAIAGQGNLALAERMAPYMTGIYTGYGSPGYLYDSLAILDNTLFRIFRYEIEGNQYDGYEADKDSLKIHVNNIAAMNPAMLSDFASLTEAIREWTARMAYISFGFQTNRPQKTDARTRGRYPYWAVEPPPPGWPIFLENRAAADRLNAVHWPNHGYGGSSERYGYMTPDDIRAGIPAVRAYVAGMSASYTRKQYYIVRIDTETPRLTEGAISFKPFRVMVMNDNGEPAADLRIRMTRSGGSTVNEQYTATDGGGLAEFSLGPYGKAGTVVEVVDIPGGKGSIDVAIDIVPRGDYAVYDGSGGMSFVTPPPAPVPVPAAKDTFPPVPRPVVQGLDWDVLAPEAFEISNGSMAIETFLSFKGRLTVLARQEWLSGTTPNRRNAIWWSRDGEAWQQIAEPPWTGRKNFQALVYGDRLYVAGGIEGFTVSNGGSGEERRSDLWYTDDGRTWIEAAPSIDCIAAQEQFRLLSHGETLWMIGYEIVGETFRNPLWYSQDGLDWTKVSDTSPWPARPPDSAGITVHDGALWIAGGKNPVPSDDGTDREFADVWKLDVTETNPVWTLVTDSPAWSRRAYAQLFSHRGMLWLWGGSQRTAENQDAVLPLQVWLSANGSYWSEPGFSPQHPAYAQASSILSLSDDLYVLYSNNYLTQRFSLWKSSSSADTETVPGRQQWFPVQPRPVTFSAGADHGAAIAPDGTLWTWGGNGYGQLGNGLKSWNAMAFPQRVGAERSWKMVSAGQSYTLAVAADGGLWSWGRNNYGQLGNGATEEQLQPARVGDENDWADISAGTTHVLARKTDGSLWAWGRNNLGQIGDGTTEDRHEPVRIGEDYDWTVVAAGAEHSLALKADGSVWGWGRRYACGFSHDTGNVPGQGRSGTYIDTGVPYDDWQNLREGVNALAAGGNNGIAIRKSGAMHPWTLETWKTRDAFDTRKAWLAAAAGHEHFLALASDNSLWGWGKNHSSILGAGAPLETAATVRIGADTDWVALDTGGNPSTPFAIARKQDGSLWAWGSGGKGQMGNGMTASSGVPRPVLPIHKHHEDSDGDWLPDAWEMEYFGTLDRDGTGDFDGDRVSDFLEYYFGMRPDLPDTDGDGILDDWELIMKLDPSFDDSNLLSAETERTTLDRVVLPVRTVDLGNFSINNSVASGDYLYLLGALETATGSMEPRLMIISLADDRVGDIVADKAIDGAGYQLQVDGGRLYTNLGSTLAVYDVSDPSDPLYAGELSLGDSGDYFAQGFAAAGDRLYVTATDSSTWNTTFQIWNIANLENPIKMGDLEGGGDGHVFIIDENRVVVTGGGNELVIVSVEDSENPAVLGVFDTFDHPCGDLVWPPVVMADGRRNLIYAPVKSYEDFATSDAAHLKILDISDPENITYPSRSSDIFRMDGWIDSLVTLGEGYVGILMYDNATYSPLIEIIDGEKTPEIHRLSRLSQFRGSPGNIAATNDWFIVASRDNLGVLLEIIPRDRLLGSPPDAPKSVITVARHRAAPGEPMYFDGSRSFHRAGARPLIRAEWDFDYDGTTFDVDAQGFETFWSFPAFGTYTVALRTVSADGSGGEVRDIALAKITVDGGNFPPRAVAGGPYRVVQGNGVVLDGWASVDPDASRGDRIVSYAWDLNDDGDFSDASGVTLALSWEEIQQWGMQGPADPATGEPANTIGLRVTDSFGLSHVDRSTLTILENRPSPRFTLWPLAPRPSEPVIFDGGASFHSVPGRSIAGYQWDFNYNGFTFNTQASGVRIAHTFAAFGDHVVALRVTDDAVPAKTALTTMEVYVAPGLAAPAAVLPPVIVLVEGSDLVLDGSASYDGDASYGAAIQSWEWDLRGNGVYDDGQGETITVTWEEIGVLGWPFPTDLDAGQQSIQVGLRVTNNVGVSSTAWTRVVIVPAGDLTARISLDPGDIQTGIPVGFSGAESTHSDAGRTIETFEWDFDFDGILFTTDAQGMEVSHSFTRLGSQTVALRVTDDGDPAERSLALLAVDVGGNRAPIARPGGPYSAVLDGTVTLDGSQSSDPDEDSGDRIVHYAWDLDGDGLYNDAVGVAPTLSAEYLIALGLAGPAHPDTGEPSNEIRLRATDSFGFSHTAATTITLYHDEPVALFSVSPDPVVAGEEITFDGTPSLHGHPDRMIVLYEWDFNYDRANFKVAAEGERPTHTFSEDLSGEVVVALRVTDNGPQAKQDIYSRTVLSSEGELLPVVRTLLVSGTSSSSAIVHGAMLSDGGLGIEGRGAVYSLQADFLPEEGSAVEADSISAGGFSVSLTGLDPGTAYYVRAWAENQAGRGYGEILSFVTVRESIPGDINGDDRVDLSDLVLCLQILSGRDVDGIDKGAAVNGDGRIGMEELLFVIQKIAELRE